MRMPMNKGFIIRTFLKQLLAVKLLCLALFSINIMASEGSKQEQEIDLSEGFGQGLSNKQQAPWQGYPVEKNTIKSQTISDTDKDGVIDERDLCTDTVLGHHVNSFGCQPGFDNAHSAHLTLDFDSKRNFSKSTLQKLKQFAQENFKTLDDGQHFILLYGQAYSQKSYEPKSVLSINLSRRLAKVLAQQYTIKTDLIRIAGVDDSYIDVNKLAPKPAQRNQVSLYILNKNSIEQVQWNIWSVELGTQNGSREQEPKSQHFMNYENLQEK